MQYELLIFLVCGVCLNIKEVKETVASNSGACKAAERQSNGGKQK
jgi:hypothetical protein